MPLAYIALLVILALCIKGRRELAADIRYVAHWCAMHAAPKKPQAKKPPKPSFEQALRAYTLEEQEKILCLVLREPTLPPKRLLLDVLHLMKKENRLSESHRLLFEKLLYEERLTLEERDRIFSDYSHLEGDEFDRLCDFLNENAQQAIVKKSRLLH